jgi:outer membrane lipoprotein-sorting protein
MTLNRILPFALITTLIALAVFVPAQAQAAQPVLTVTTISSGKGKPPTCDVFATRKKLRAGESSTLIWHSKRADYMTALYTTEEREANGRMKIRFSHPGKQEFRLLFVGEGGATTCDYTVNVGKKRGGTTHAETDA